MAIELTRMKCGVNRDKSLFSTAGGSSARSGICCCLCQLLGRQRTTAPSLFKEAPTLSFSASSLPSSPFLSLILHNISQSHPTLIMKNVQQNPHTAQPLPRLALEYLHLLRAHSITLRVLRLGTSHRTALQRVRSV